MFPKHANYKEFKGRENRDLDRKHSSVTASRDFGISLESRITEVSDEATSTKEDRIDQVVERDVLVMGTSIADPQSYGEIN